MRVLAALVLAISIVPAVAFSAATSPTDDAGLAAELARHRGRMTRVTKRPYRVYQPGALLCAQPNAAPHSPHGDHWIHVFVSHEGRTAMKTGKGGYPVGSLILKQKFLDASGKRTDFYTGMRKREPRFNPKLGDWEFFTLDSSAKKVTSQGKIAACMDCHRQYAKTDYVAREYLTLREQSHR
jgi:hypothetical protein